MCVCVCANDLTEKTNEERRVERKRDRQTDRLMTSKGTAFPTNGEIGKRNKSLIENRLPDEQR